MSMHKMNKECRNAVGERWLRSLLLLRYNTLLNQVEVAFAITEEQKSALKKKIQSISIQLVSRRWKNGWLNTDTAK